VPSSRRSRGTARHFDAAIWELRDTKAPIPKLRDVVAAAHEEEPETQITAFAVIDDSGEPLRRVAPHAFDSNLQYARAEAVELLQIVPRGRTSFVISSWPTNVPGVFLVVGSVPFTDPRWRRLQRWVADAAPTIAVNQLELPDFKAMNSALSEAGAVEVSRVTARAVDGSSYSRGWPAARSMERPGFTQVLAEVEEVPASIRSLTLHVHGVLYLHVRRRTGVTYYSGSFELFENAVLSQMVEGASGRHRLLSGRGRPKGEPAETGLVVTLPQPTFADGEGSQELIGVLSRQPAAGVAVLHGNPYLHLAVTDFRDGSNFDAFVTSDAEITIVPGNRATVGSLMRLIQPLTDRFAATDLTDASVVRPPTLADLFSTG
jgi:hypothetical protein